MSHWGRFLTGHFVPFGTHLTHKKGEKMFNLGLDKKTITIILVVMLGFWILTSGTNSILNMLIMMPGILIALTFHEFAHAFTAYKLGDNTAKEQGRISLNPFKHIDPMGFVFLVVAGFGWGKPVEIDSRNFRKNMRTDTAEAIVAAAGPIANFILAFLLMILYYALFNASNAMSNLSPNVYYVIALILRYAVTINIGLGLFNLIPLPPLDGSKVLMRFLSYNAKQWFSDNQQIFYIIFLLIWITRNCIKNINTSI
jgi:Zn-dependent protease